jgi:glutathione peroxidase
MEFYKYTAQSLSGDNIPMSHYKGKLVLVVNTASKCGFTPQFEGLEKLYQAYKDKGFIVLGFPCNQFLNQEPGDEQSIQEGCVLNYGVTFPMFSKVNVNGDNAHPIFKFLKKELKGIIGSTIEWNFTKFLIDPEGKLIKRFAPVTTPEEINTYLKRTLKH